MIKERLQKDSNVPVFSSIKKIMIKSFKRSKSKKRIQLQAGVIKLSDYANLCTNLHISRTLLVIMN